MRSQRCLVLRVRRYSRRWDRGRTRSRPSPARPWNGPGTAPAARRDATAPRDDAKRREQTITRGRRARRLVLRTRQGVHEWTVNISTVDSPTLIMDAGKSKVMKTNAMDSTKRMYTALEQVLTHTRDAVFKKQTLELEKLQRKFDRLNYSQQSLIEYTCNTTTIPCYCEGWSVDRRRRRRRGATRSRRARRAWIRSMPVRRRRSLR